LYEHPNNPRKQLNIDELVESIKEMGLLTAILVRPWGDGFQIISGHRRKVAITKIGSLDVNCDVVEMDDEQAFKALMTANIQSHSLSELEEAEGIRQMIEQFKWTQDRVSKEFGKTQNWVSYRLSLLGLDESIKEKIITRVINPTQARGIAQAPKELQSAIADKVVKEDLTTRETEQLVKVLKDESISPELKQKAIETNIPPTEIQKMAIKADIKQAVQEARHDILAEHQASGMKPPIPTDEELNANKRLTELEGFFKNLRGANLLVQPDPKMIDLMIEFNRSKEAIDHLTFIADQIKSLSQKIIDAQKNQLNPAKKQTDGKVVEMKRK
jgi:ParB family chromosome partitioning protein